MRNRKKGACLAIYFNNSKGWMFDANIIEEMCKVTDTFWAEREVIRPCTFIDMKKRSYSLTGSYPVTTRKQSKHQR